jgi:glutamate dehydrogenase
MNSPGDALEREQIDAALRLAAAQASEDRQPLTEAVAEGWFRQLDADDQAERTLPDLCGALLSLWHFGAARRPGRPKMRVLSPSLAEHGWSSRHSVIEIVNDDMPFLVDSTTAEINRQGLTLHLIVHPIYDVDRDAEGRLTAIRPPGGATGATRESWISIEVDRLGDAQQAAELTAGIERVLADVRAAVEDWKPMVARLEEASAELAAAPATVPAEALAESRAFLQWLAANHFTLLGYRQHRLVAEKGEDALRLVVGSGLGVLRETEAERASASFSELPPEARALAHAPTPVLIVTKANRRSTVHRPGYTDYIGVKRYDDEGRVIGEHRFLGLFTSTAYSARVADTPLLRGRVEAIAERAGLPPGGHLAKALGHILETYPRDELFQITDDELYEQALGILALGDRQRLRLFVRVDPFARFVSCLVYVPRDAYSTDMRVRFQRILMEAFASSSAEFNVQLGETVLARIHFMIHTAPGQTLAIDRKELEGKLVAAARRWTDELRDALIEAAGEAAGLALYKQWSAALPPEYRERVPARQAVPDVRKIAALSADEPLGLALYRPGGGAADALGFKLYRLGEPIVLSDSLPMLEHMGVRVLGEQSNRIGGGPSTIALHDFELQAQIGEQFDFEELARLFEDAFARVFRGDVEKRRLQPAGAARRLAADEIVVLRAYAKYLRQIGFALSQGAIEATLRPIRASRACWSRCSVCASIRQRTTRRAKRRRSGDRAGAREGQQPVRGPRAAPAARADPGDLANELLAHRVGHSDAPGRAAASSASSSTRPGCPACPSRSRCTRSSSTRRASRASTCAAARSRAAACAGPIGPRTFAPRCSGWSRRRW